MIPKTLYRPVKDAVNELYPFGAPRIGGRPGTHRGWDFLSPAGTICRAAQDGVVSYVRTGSFQGDVSEGGYGSHIVLDHNGYGSLYAHLTRVEVKQGQEVSRGEMIGLTGTTGISSGPHLHWEVLDHYSPIYGGSPSDGLAYVGQEDEVTRDEYNALVKRIEKLEGRQATDEKVVPAIEGRVTKLEQRQASDEVVVPALAARIEVLEAAE